MDKDKWDILFRGYLCKCGKVFLSSKHFHEHLRDTRRYRKLHYAPDYNEVGFSVHIMKRRGCNLNEAFFET